MSPSITLRVKKHCIECVAKNELNRLMDIYYKNNILNTNEIEKKIGLLLEFLKNYDFSKLRSSDERLSGEIESEITLGTDSDNNISLSVQGTVLYIDGCIK